jgi:putative phage-type endonuclease
MNLTPAQLAKRRTGIGSSDVSAIAEVDPWREPLDVWLSKVGLVDIETTPAMQSGHDLEDPIAKMYERAMGAKLARVRGTLRHPKHPIALATLDRRAKVGPAPIVEVKNVGPHQLADWRGGAPAHVVLQVQWQLAVDDAAELAHIAALLGGTEFRVFPVVRDRDLGEAMFELAEDFWDEHVLTRIPPPCSPDAAQRLAALRYPRNDGALLPKTPEARALAHELADIHDEQAALKLRRDRCEAAAKELIGPADGVEACFTWKLDAEGRTSWEAIARALGASDELIAAHTKPPTTRKFLLDRSRWSEATNRRKNR